MNRFDEIQSVARDIASNVHDDPESRDAMADDLIRLCGLMIQAVGKIVACDGEAKVDDPDDEGAYERYIIGERIQDAARETVVDSSNEKCDLDRWRRPTPGTGCRCGHVPSVHLDGGCTGEQYNGEACKGGPCTGFVTREPEGGWVHTDRRPEALRNVVTYGETVARMTGGHSPDVFRHAASLVRCTECGRSSEDGCRPVCVRYRQHGS